MNIGRQIEFWRTGKTIASINNDINDELQFHIDCRADELIEQGWASDTARAEANRCFGNRGTIESQCRKVQTGPMAWLMPLSLTSLIVSAVVIGMMTYSMIVLRTQNAELTAQLESAVSSSASLPTGFAPVPAMTNPKPQDEKVDLKGKIVDDAGKPIAGAKILLIHKSWPNQQYRQEDNSTETNEDGSFVFEKCYSTDTQNAFLVAVLADGYEMKSQYELFKAKKKAAAFSFKLKAAKTITFTFLGEDGNPLAESDVVLLSRKVGTKEHMV